MELRDAELVPNFFQAQQNQKDFRKFRKSTARIIRNPVPNLFCL